LLSKQALKFLLPRVKLIFYCILKIKNKKDSRSHASFKICIFNGSAATSLYFKSRKIHLSPINFLMINKPAKRFRQVSGRNPRRKICRQAAV
jgi:hypothetical protein